MPKVPEFNAADWIAQNTVGGLNLSIEAQQAVADFTTMWNFFESTHCDNRASIAAFEHVVEQYEPTEVSGEALKACLTFWSFRYRSRDGFSTRFDGLYFRQRDRRDHVEKVLLGEVEGAKEELLALLIIVYRLRNNLFHGLKTLEMLNDQVENLRNASRCMAAAMEAIPSRFILRRTS